MATTIEAYRVEADQLYEQYRSLSLNEAKSVVEQLREGLQIHIVKLDAEEMVFDLVGVDASLANALRRILLAEVPSMAIETVHLFANSSILHDEVLAHRLGLVPILADPALFEELPAGAEATEHNTLVFDMDVSFVPPKSDPGAAANDPASALSAPTMNVLSNQLVWRPMGEQGARLAACPPRVVHPDILLAKLKPGQRIKVEGWCRKGVGKDHAKFSPVCTASYRLLPRIDLVEPVVGAEAEDLAKRCPMQVFDIEDMGGGGGGSGKKGGGGAGQKKQQAQQQAQQQQAVVARPRDCTMCRECVREGPAKEKVKLRRVADHFVFSIESVGALPPERILKDAIDVLRRKCHAVLQAVEEAGEGTTAATTTGGGGAAAAAGGGGGGGGGGGKGSKKGKGSKGGGGGAE